MRKSQNFLLVSALIVLLLAGCSTNFVSKSSGGGGGTTGNATVSLSMTDDPPAGVQVLFFQISLTAATLTPESTSGAPVSLLSNNTPVQIDVTQLQALSAFLSTANIAAGEYASLNLTFANPQLVIYNASDTGLSNCAVESICQVTPTLAGATVNLTSAPFPVTLSAGSPLGFLIDFHLNHVIQPDLSVNLGVNNGVTVSELPPATGSAPPQFGSLIGTVESVSAQNNTFTVQTAWGRTFTIGTTSSTAYDDFPSSACTAAGFGCLAQGQIVQVQIGQTGSGGALTASQVTYVQAATAQTVEGTVVAVFPCPCLIVPAPVTLIMMVHQNPTNASTFPIGGMVEVEVTPPATSLSIDTNGFTMPPGVQFGSDNYQNFVVGQELSVTVQPGTLGTTPPILPQYGMGPSVYFMASSVELEPSQMTGAVLSVDDSAQSFAFGGNTGPIFFPWPWGPNAVNSFNVLTTGQTGYTGFTPDSFDGLAQGQVVSVNGWLFGPQPESSTAQIVAQDLVLRPNGTF